MLQYLICQQIWKFESAYLFYYENGDCICILIEKVAA